MVYLSAWDFLALVEELPSFLDRLRKVSHVWFWCLLWLSAQSSQGRTSVSGLSTQHQELLVSVLWIPTKADDFFFWTSKKFLSGTLGHFTHRPAQSNFFSSNNTLVANLSALLWKEESTRMGCFVKIATSNLNQDRFPVNFPAIFIRFFWCSDFSFQLLR